MRLLNQLLLNIYFLAVHFGGRLVQELPVGWAYYANINYMIDFIRRATMLTHFWPGKTIGKK